MITLTGYKSNHAAKLATLANFVEVMVSVFLLFMLINHEIRFSPICALSSDQRLGRISVNLFVTFSKYLSHHTFSVQSPLKHNLVDTLKRQRVCLFTYFV